jgi:hypothetical protein
MFMLLQDYVRCLEPSHSFPFEVVECVLLSPPDASVASSEAKEAQVTRWRRKLEKKQNCSKSFKKLKQFCVKYLCEVT